METTFNPQANEQLWYERWEQRGYFAPSTDANAQPYCIMTPPPNVTGSLHMGHAFQNTLMDALIRYHRMKGCSTLWQAGTDHAGIATQMVVERQLAAQDLTRHALGRENFIEKVWQWKAESGGRITQQLRRMGASLDWSRERFTMDPSLSKAVQKVFIELHEEGLIYRGQRLVNWDPKLHTAISDLEVISEEEAGSMWYFNYPVENSNETITVATTRPETMLGDSAVAVHPDDERYKHLIGQQVKLPITDRLIPIIADDYVDKDFGTGAVKITPAHDFNDYEMGLRHQLPVINILTIDATLNDQVPIAYQGLDRFVARKKVVADLEALGLVEKIVPHTLKIPRGDRSGVVIEPFLTYQWYVKVAPLAEPAIRAVENGDIEFVPKNWENTYFSWMRNIQDWCISRQLWWGHRIPAWYDEQGKVYVGENEQSVREKNNIPDAIQLHQDEDVLDTWFSSALWTFSTLGWPEQTEALKKFHPTDVLVTGFDIIFFWVARMIMMTLKFTGEIPFKKVYVHGLVRDSEGQKMSKSKGNVLDPLDLIDGIQLDDLVAKRAQGLMQPQMAQKIEKTTRKQFPEGIASYGTDALRFTFCSLASTGRDIQFDMGRIEGYRNFCNKLWNAARFVLMNTGVLMNTEQATFTQAPDLISLNVIDRWILSRLQTTIDETTQALEQFRFDHAAQHIYDFTWYEYCDWYLELSKQVLQDETASAQQKQSTQFTLLSVLENLLRLMHPIMPFITETIWQEIKTKLNIAGDSIMIQPFPQIQVELRNEAAEQEVTWLKAAITAVRNLRGEMNVSPAKRIPLFFRGGDAQDKQRTKTYQANLIAQAKLSSMEWLEGNSTTLFATQWVGSLELLVPMADLIDKEAEIQRLTKLMQKQEGEVQRLTDKLSNPQFTDRAPAAVVEKERASLNEATESLQKLSQQVQTIQAM